VTLEENAAAGGAGSAVSELLAETGVEVRCLHLGLPDRFLDQASRQEQLADCGLDAPGIEAAVRDALAGTELDRPLPKGNAGA
jgi:1-deoxy-D-xylulose-5-phosphate synthase